MSKELKEFIANDLRSQFSADVGFVAVDYHGLDAELTVDFRKSLREAGGRVIVVPNRLARRVFCESVGEAAEKLNHHLTRQHSQPAMGRTSPHKRW